MGDVVWTRARALAELSTLTLLLEPAAVFLPAARFPAFIWIICVGWMMPSRSAAIEQVSR
jgi:hypothetical protein